jgi:DNA-binding IscR family transcriptional regulator
MDQKFLRFASPNYTYHGHILSILSDGRERYTAEIASAVGIPDVFALSLLERMHEGGVVSLRRWVSGGQNVSAWKGVA